MASIRGRSAPAPNAATPGRRLEWAVEDLNRARAGGDDFAYEILRGEFNHIDSYVNERLGDPRQR